jgi:hypothetical protein
MPFHKNLFDVAASNLPGSAASFRPYVLSSSASCRNPITWSFALWSRTKIADLVKQ